MNIHVNKNFDEYKDDFFKGLPPRETLFGALTLLSGAGSFVACTLLFDMPQLISTYITILFTAPPAILGFFKIDNMSILKYCKKKRECKKNALFLYESEESIFIEEVAADKLSHHPIYKFFKEKCLKRKPNHSINQFLQKKRKGGKNELFKKSNAKI